MQKGTYVRFIPRSDDNDIHPGDVYEMRYWNANNKRILCGIQTAEGNTLHYDNIPKGALMWVSNYTRSMDERPFLIDDDGNVVLVVKCILSKNHERTK